MISFGDFDANSVANKWRKKYIESSSILVVDGKFIEKHCNVFQIIFQSKVSELSPK